MAAQEGSSCSGGRRVLLSSCCRRLRSHCHGGDVPILGSSSTQKRMSR